MLNRFSGACALALALAVCAPASATTYIATSLSDNGFIATDINDSGLIGGHINAAAYIRQLDGTQVSLGGNGIAVSVNDAGQATFGQQALAYLWDPNTGLAQIVNAFGGNFVAPAAINDSGVVAGGAANSNIGFADVGFLWTKATGMVQTSNFIATDINNLGATSGTAGLAAYYRAPDGTLTRIDSAAFVARATALNESGQVVGWSRATQASSSQDPFFWDGALHFIDDGRQVGNAVDINDLGVVIGASSSPGVEQQGWTWTSADGLQFLTGNVGNAPGLQIRNVMAINNLGQILVQAGYQGASSFSYLLTPATGPVNPVPEPSVWAMLIVGFGLVGAGLRRRRQQDSAPALV